MLHSFQNSPFPLPSTSGPSSTEMVRPEILGEAGMHWEGIVFHLPQGQAVTRDPPAAGGGILWLSVVCLTPLGPACMVVVPFLI